MKREKQIQESKNMIKDALFTLLLEKNFRDITISEITDKAGVARMTFYRNFASKEEIILYLFQSILKEIKDEVMKIPTPSIKDLIRIRFEVIQKNQYIDQLVSKNEILELLIEFRKTNMSSFDHLLPSIDSYTRQYKMGGIQSVTELWIKTGMRESPQEMTDRIIKLID